VFLETVEPQDGGQYSLATLRMFRAAIAYAHHDAGDANPCRDIEVKRALQGIINRRKRDGASMSQREAMPILKMDAMMMVTSRAEYENPVRDARDKALVVFGRSLAARRSELLALRVNDLEFITGGVAVNIRWGKTDQAATGNKLYIPTIDGPLCPVSTLRAWLNTAEIVNGPVFRAVNKGGRVADMPMSDAALNLVLKRLARQAGIDDERVSGHSLRAGFATDAAKAGVHEHRIKQHGRWKSDVWRRYVRDVIGLDADNPVNKIW